MQQILPIFIFITISVIPMSGRADLFEPFSTSNLNPFVQLYGIPATRSAHQAADGAFAWQLQTEVANNFTDNAGDNETIVIDGETWKTTLSLRYGITDRWEVALDVPYMRHDGGSLDSFIEDWHGWFGLPNGGREDVLDDQLAYLYQLDGVTRVNLQDTASGIGDVRLSVGYLLGQEEDRSWSFRAGVKLPTGDPEDLTGSDGTDLFMSLHLSDASLIKHENWYFHGSLGVLVPEGGDVIKERVEDYVVFGSTTVSWHTWENIALKAQLDFHSSMYESELKELDELAVQLVLGGSVRLGEKLLLDVSVSEDIVTDASPDVVFQLGLRSRF